MTKVLLQIQILINNLQFVAITKTFNKMILNFTLDCFLDLLTEENTVNPITVQINTKNVILFA